MTCHAQIKRPLESDLQIGVINWLDAYNIDAIYYANSNEATYKNKKLQKMGMRPGVPDLTFAGMPNCPLGYIELKRHNGKLSADQKDFKSDCDERGIPCAMIATDDLLEMTEILKTYLIEWGAI